MKELLEIIRERRAQPAIPFALATVVRMVGSSYRKPGARMLISLHGRVAGSVSGGCLERDVITRARAVIFNQAPDLAIYDTTDQDDMAFGTSLGCEGRIEILIQPLLTGAAWPLADAVDLVLQRRAPIVLTTAFQAKQLDWIGRSLEVGSIPAHWRSVLAPVADAVLTGKKTANAQIDDGKIDLLIERLAPPVQLVILGGGHDVPPLVRLAKEVGYHVTVVDRRADFADPDRFPGADAVLHLRPHEIQKSGLMADDSAAVLMNHHYETDAESLIILVKRRLLYLGVLGPRKRTVKILRETGMEFSADELEKVHSPVGLDLGSDTPEQIALCILAELQAVVNGRAAVNLRERSSLIEELVGEPVAHR